MKNGNNGGEGELAVRTDGGVNLWRDRAKNQESIDLALSGC